MRPSGQSLLRTVARDLAVPKDQGEGHGSFVFDAAGLEETSAAHGQLTVRNSGYARLHAELGEFMLRRQEFRLELWVGGSRYYRDRQEPRDIHSGFRRNRSFDGQPSLQMNGDPIDLDRRVCGRIQSDRWGCGSIAALAVCSLMSAVLSFDSEASSVRLLARST